MALEFFFHGRVDAVPAYAAAAVLLAAALAVWLLVRTSSTSKPLKDGLRTAIVLPSTLPVLGNLLDISKHKNDRHDWFASLFEKYEGHPFQLSMPGRPTATLVCSPAHVEDILKTNFDSLPKGPIICDAFRDFSGYGIFAVDGAKWIHQRKTASNMFTARAMRDSMAESMRRYAVVLERILQTAHDADAAIDVFSLMNRFTMEAFAKMGFGVDVRCLESDDEPLFQRAFDNAQRMLVTRTQRPRWFWKLQRILNLGNEAQLKKDIATIDKTVLDIIAQSLARRQELAGAKDNDASGCGDIVSLFLDRFDGSDGEFDPKYLRDIVINFVIAGRDTTAQTMSWCFYNLDRHPDVVAKIRAEIAHVLPEYASGRRAEPPTMDEVQQLVFLDATLKETLRLHPPVPLVTKTVVQDVVLSDGTFLRGGSFVSIAAYSMARMESIWGPDAKQFKPERWIDPATGKLRNISAFQFPAFNAGPRLCLGMNLAMLEMKIVMASVLTHFDINLLQDQHITYDNSVTLPVKGSMLARVAKARAA